MCERLCARGEVGRAGCRVACAYADRKSWPPWRTLGPRLSTSEQPAAPSSMSRGRRSHEQDLLLRGNGVIRGSPLGDPGRPDLERVLDRAVDFERQADRLDHRPRRSAIVFAATSRNRTVASPRRARQRLVRPQRHGPRAGRRAVSRVAFRRPGRALQQAQMARDGRPAVRRVASALASNDVIGPPASCCSLGRV